MPDNQPFHFCVTGNGSRIGGNRVESLLGTLPQVREESCFVVEQVGASHLADHGLQRGSLTVRGEIFFENNWLTIW